MKVREAMAKTVSCAAPSDSLQQVARLMKAEDAGFIPVVEGERLVGVVTDRDIVIRCLAEGQVDPRQETVQRVMSAGVHTIPADAELEAAAEAMAQAEVRRLAVVEGDRLVGILS